MLCLALQKLSNELVPDRLRSIAVQDGPIHAGCHAFVPLGYCNGAALTQYRG
jgi:hypothetical protein